MWNTQAGLCVWTTVLQLVALLRKFVEPLGGVALLEEHSSRGRLEVLSSGPIFYLFSTFYCTKIWGGEEFWWRLLEQSIAAQSLPGQTVSLKPRVKINSASVGFITVFIHGYNVCTPFTPHFCLQLSYTSSSSQIYFLMSFSFVLSKRFIFVILSCVYGCPQQSSVRPLISPSMTTHFRRFSSWLRGPMCLGRTSLRKKPVEEEALHPITDRKQEVEDSGLFIYVCVFVCVH